MKKILILLLVIVFTASIVSAGVGCKGETVEETTEETEEEAKEEAKEEEEADEEAATEAGIPFPEPGKTLIYNADAWEEEIGMALEYKEAPMLAEMVANGEIPALEDRLPKNPLVIKPSQEIGQYGGTLMFKLPSNLRMDFGYEFVCMWHADTNYGIYDNVIESWDANEDGSVYTFHLREGLKWSDGVDFTADDFMFWYEDFALNADINEAVPNKIVVGGEPGVFKKIDDYTLEISFAAPYALFIENQGRWRPNMYMPAHYMKQYHASYVAEAELDKLVADEEFGTWVELFMDRHGDWDPLNVMGRPTLSAWIRMHDTDQPVQTFVRNPYYFKVDSEGNQLPYLDQIEGTISEDPEALLLQTMAGEFDLINGAYIGQVENRGLIMDSADTGEYGLWPNVSPEVFGTLLGRAGFNMSSTDPVLKELFNDKNFRIALSIAIDRDEMNQYLFDGLGTPAHMNVPYGTPFYGENLFQDYLQFDVEEAKRLLDDLGLDKLDADGNRLRSDGKPLDMVWLVADNLPGYEKASSLMAEYWEELGITAIVKPMSHDMLKEQREAGNYDLIMTGGGYGAYGPSNPLMVNAAMPTDINYVMAPQWGIWVESGGEKGDEPPQAIKDIVALRDQAMSSGDPDKRIALTIEILEILSEEFYNFGAVVGPPGSTYWIVRNRVGNATRNPGMIHAGEWIFGPVAQLFIKE
ncbi:MAG: ABC transporter substrate-binding protein [Actinomycetia bacterium]|nr:ABC transporter substrate-binding protein [Actinomycetes bacterium]